MSDKAIIKGHVVILTYTGSFKFSIKIYDQNEFLEYKFIAGIFITIIILKFF